MSWMPQESWQKIYSAGHSVTPGAKSLSIPLLLLDEISTISLCHWLANPPPKKVMTNLHFDISLQIYKQYWILKTLTWSICSLASSLLHIFYRPCFSLSLFLFPSLTAVCLTLPGKLRHVRPCGAAASKTKLSKDWERKAGSKGRYRVWLGANCHGFINWQ